MEFIKEALTSKKFWVMVAAVIGGFAIEGKSFTGKAFIIVTGWLAAQGAADLGTALAKKPGDVNVKNSENVEVNKTEQPPPKE